MVLESSYSFKGHISLTARESWVSKWKFHSRKGQALSIYLLHIGGRELRLGSKLVRHELSPGVWKHLETYLEILYNPYGENTKSSELDCSIFRGLNPNLGELLNFSQFNFVFFKMEIKIHL